MPCDSLGAAGAVIRAARCAIMGGIYIDRARSTDQRRVIRFFTRCLRGVFRVCVKEGISVNLVGKGIVAFFLFLYLVLSRVYIFFFVGVV